MNTFFAILWEFIKLKWRETKGIRVTLYWVVGVISALLGLYWVNLDKNEYIRDIIWEICVIIFLIIVAVILLGVVFIFFSWLRDNWIWARKIVEDRQKIHGALIIKDSVSRKLKPKKKKPAAKRKRKK